MPRLPAALLVLLALTACVRDPEPEPLAAPTPVATPTPQLQAYAARVPAEGFLGYDPAEIERNRLDAAWRAAAERDLARRRQEVPPPPPPETLAQSRDAAAVEPDTAPPIDRLRGAAPPAAPAPTPATAASPRAAETFESISADSFSAPPSLPVGGKGAGPTVLRVQRLLDRARFSPGAIDGHWGKNTEKAIFWLQAALGLESTGKVDDALYQRLVTAAGDDEAVRAYTLTADDLAGPFVQVPEGPEEQAKLDCLCPSSPAEGLAERFHTTRDVLARLNPGVDLERLSAGTQVTVPNVETVAKNPARLDRIARLVISKGGWYLHAEDAGGEVLFHFPITIGSAYDPSPDGELRVTGIAYDPDFHYQPKLFAEVPDDEPEHLLPPGPNSPVGLVWMALSKENFGIHGTAEPETIGYASSHGCIRMTNWDAVFLANHIAQGVPVEFVD